MEESIDFVITGTTTSNNDSVATFPCAPHGQSVKFPIQDGRFTVTGRLPRNTFFQIGDYEGNDLRFIVDDVPTEINLVTGEVRTTSTRATPSGPSSCPKCLSIPR